MGCNVASKLGSTVTRQRRGTLATLLMMMPLMVCAAPVHAASDAPLRLQWEVERNVFAAGSADGRSQAALLLTNLDSKPLPAKGWAIYFTCIAGVELGQAQSPVSFEQVSGTLFRLRPSAGFKPLAAGRTVRLSFFHPEIMARMDKAPQGPYLVLDDAPEVGHAIVDYRIALPTRPEQLDKGPGDRVPVVTAEAIYQRNQLIVDLPEDQLAPVFPSPRQFERRAGKLTWTALPAVIAASGLQSEQALAKSLLAPYFASGKSDSSAPSLHLRIAPIAGQASAEAYELGIDPVAGIVLTGNSETGVARGLQSLRQLLPLRPGSNGELALPALFISDAPRFEYRGLLLDVARNFQSKQTVFKLLDLMARYKLNKFHLHLTDDEGWRLEIPGIPELTDFGARRGHTLAATGHLQPAHGSGPDLDDAYGSGFYSSADYIEIVKYAAARQIDVIPEIEMPGHARAAVKAMESRFRRIERKGGSDARQFLLSDPDDKSDYHSAQLYTDNVMNPGMPSTYVFIGHVVDELVALHKRAGVPLRTIVVGGDELASGAWEKSPAALALMARLQLGSTTGLWDYFYDNVDQILRARGLITSGWEELGARKVKLRGEGKLIPNPVFSQRGFNVYVWNKLEGSEDLAYRLANAGYATVLTPATDLYFDLAYNKNPEEPGVDWAGTTDLDEVYDFIPFDYIRKTATDPTPIPGKDGLTDYGQRNIRGLEAALFTETVRDPARIDYLLMPRLLGLAERAWAPDPAWARETDPAKAAAEHAAAWSAFANQLGKQVLPRLDAERADVRYRIPPPGLKLVNGAVLVNYQLPGFTLRYSTDGGEPDMDSPIVAAPITTRAVIKVAAFDRNGRNGRSSQLENH